MARFLPWLDDHLQPDFRLLFELLSLLFHFVLHSTLRHTAAGFGTLFIPRGYYKKVWYWSISAKELSVTGMLLRCYMGTNNDRSITACCGAISPMSWWSFATGFQIIVWTIVTTFSFCTTLHTKACRGGFWHFVYPKKISQKSVVLISQGTNNERTVTTWYGVISPMSWWSFAPDFGLLFQLLSLLFHFVLHSTIRHAVAGFGTLSIPRGYYKKKYGIDQPRN